MQRALLFVLLAGGLEAHAMCASPEAYFLPRPGTPLPSNPTVFLIVPSAAYGKVDAATKFRAVSEKNAELPLTLDTQPTVSDLTIIKFSVKARAGTRFAIEGLRRPAVWPVEEQTLPAAPLKLLRVRDTFSSWTCSYESLRNFDSSVDAPAYRVEFAATEVDLRAGKSTQLVVEGRDDAFRHDDDERPRLLESARVQLGHRNCWGHNFTWATPKVAVRITALLSDGTERASAEVFVLAAPRDPSGQ